MSVFLASGIIQLAGGLIVTAALIQACVSLYGTLRRSAVDRRYQRLALEDLRNRVNTTLAAFNFERDRSELAWGGHRKFVLAQKVKEADDIHSFYLKPHDGKPLPPFRPGQYLTFGLRISAQPQMVVRCYSLSDSASRLDHYRITVKKIVPPVDAPDAQPGLSSTYFNDELNEGDILDVRAPNGHFFLRPEQDLPAVLIGGGIGITPILSMLNTLCDSGYGGEIWFFLGVHNSTDHVMREHLREVAATRPNVHVCTFYSSPLPEDQQGHDYDYEGFINVEEFKRLLPSNNYSFFICGPPPMMESLTGQLVEWGVPRRKVHFEAFGSDSVQKAKMVTKATDVAELFEITFTRSQKTVAWGPNSETLLELAEANGIVMDCACRSGGCGTCVTAVVSGEVDYLMEPGHMPDEGSCLTCISRPASNLSLDA